jgi:hypothetical protein
MDESYNTFQHRSVDYRKYLSPFSTVRQLDNTLKTEIFFIITLP